MKSLILPTILTGILASCSFAQTVDVAPRNAFHGAQPASCAVGDTWDDTSQTAGQNWKICTTAGTPGTWTVQGGGGAVVTCDDATVTSGTLTLMANASTSVPCNYTFDTTVRRFTATVPVTSPTGTDTWYVGVLPSGGLAVGANTATATCASCSGGVTATGVTSFAGLGAFVRPLYTATTTSTAWNTSSLTDYRARQGTVPVVCGIGTTCTDSGATVSVAVGSVPSASIPASIRTRMIGYTFDIGGTALTSGVTKYLTVPFACTISAWNIAVDTGTATVKTWKIATGTAVPTVANTISTSGVSISSGPAIHSTTLTDFTSTAVSANDIFGFNLFAVSSATYVNFILECAQ